MDEFEDKTEEIGMKELELKYGCNPNQKPSRIYIEGKELPVTVLNGRPGYINFMDALNGIQLVMELKRLQDYLRQLLSNTFPLPVPLLVCP